MKHKVSFLVIMILVTMATGIMTTTTMLTGVITIIAT
jgi:hypothetical protein